MDNANDIKNDKTEKLDQTLKVKFKEGDKTKFFKYFSPDISSADIVSMSTAASVTPIAAEEYNQ